MAAFDGVHTVDSVAREIAASRQASNELRRLASSFHGTLAGMAAGAGLTVGGVLMGLLSKQRSAAAQREHDKKDWLLAGTPGVSAYNLGKRMHGE